MYNARVRILAISGLLVLLGIIARLAQLQLGTDSALQDRITRLKDQRGRSQSLKTVRGKILDRNGRVLAYDEPLFTLRIRYDLSRYLDTRVQQALRLQILKKTDPDEVLAELNRAFETNLEVLREVIGMCSRFGDPCEVIEQKIQRYNDRIWDQRTFQAWRKYCTASPLFKKHADNLLPVKLVDVLADFERCIPNPNDRLMNIGSIEIAEMRGSSPLIDLKTDDDFMAAQLEFMNVSGITIVPEPVRVYPYKTAAAQTIGWVGLASQEKDRDLFANDPCASYLEGEVCGREDGVEYVCEAVLRGRRGKVVYDIDGTISHRIPSRLGQDVRLTIDIDLQKKIEEVMQNYPHASYCGPGMAAVVIDAAEGDVLAMVSLPVYDLSLARYHYEDLAADGNQPLVNRALNWHYPPGSVVRPVVLVAGLQTGVITPDEVISCPSRPAPQGWPNCWIFRKSGVGHDKYWVNFARNAIKGSCNIYFSRLADRIEPRTFQEWLFAFGYGRQAQFAYPISEDPNDRTASERTSRRIRQASGQISSRPEYGAFVQGLDQVPPLDPGDRALVGIGEGKFSASPIQVAGAMAALARGGIYKPPRLFLPFDVNSLSPSSPSDKTTHLGLTEQTLETIYEGLYAVVNEENGTANEAFKNHPRAQQGLRVYGKTGSTQRPDHAWFAGFAKDSRGRTIALALVVEGGQGGGSDAAPLGREIIDLCVETGHLGR